MLITVMAQATVIVLLLKEMRTSPLVCCKTKSQCDKLVHVGVYNAKSKYSTHHAIVNSHLDQADMEIAARKESRAEGGSQRDE